MYTKPYFRKTSFTKPYGVIILFLFLAFASCNTSKSKNKEDVTAKEKIQISPSEDNEIRDIKFNIYCIYAGKKFAFLNDSSKILDYVSCELVIDSISEFNDTLEMKVLFYYKHKLLNLNELVKNTNRNITRILYSKKEKRIIEYITNWNLGFYEKDISSRYYRSLQPEVILFLNENKNILNGWLKVEGMRRGIIQ